MQYMENPESIKNVTLNGQLLTRKKCGVIAKTTQKQIDVKACIVGKLGERRKVTYMAYFKLSVLNDTTVTCKTYKGPFILFLHIFNFSICPLNVYFVSIFFQFCDFLSLFYSFAFKF